MRHDNSKIRRDKELRFSVKIHKKVRVLEYRLKIYDGM